jgi:hypothetical protein
MPSSGRDDSYFLNDFYTFVLNQRNPNGLSLAIRQNASFPSLGSRLPACSCGNPETGIKIRAVVKLIYTTRTQSSSTIKKRKGTVPFIIFSMEKKYRMVNPPLNQGMKKPDRI